MHHKITPKSAQLQGNFINKNNKYKAEKGTLLSHLNEHVWNFKSFCRKDYSLCTELKQLNVNLLFLVIINHINTLQYKERLASIKTKNKKLKKPIQNNTPASK